MKNNFFKKTIFLIFSLLVISLIISTFLPPELAHRYLYQAIWFKGLGFIIAIGIILSMINLLKRKDFRLAIIHFGLLLILFGGFLTSLLGEEGFMEIKEAETIEGFWVEDESFKPLDFSLSLKDFSVEYYPEQTKGMPFVKSYKSVVAISKEGNLLKEAIIEVNRPLSFAGYNFYQYGYDADFPEQTILQVVKDPGVGFVYGGYLILLFGLITSFKKIWKI